MFGLLVLYIPLHSLCLDGDTSCTSQQPAKNRKNRSGQLIASFTAGLDNKNATYGLSTKRIISLKLFLIIVLTQAVYRLIIGVASE